MLQHENSIKTHFDENVLHCNVETVETPFSQLHDKQGRNVTHHLLKVDQPIESYVKYILHIFSTTGYQSINGKKNLKPNIPAVLFETTTVSHGFTDGALIEKRARN